MEKDKHFPIAVLLILLLQGCMVAQQVMYSAPTVGDSSTGGTSSAIRIETSGLTMGLDASYRYEAKGLMGILLIPPVIPLRWTTEPGPGDVPAETGIVLTLDPKGQPLSFSPMQVILRTEDGKDLRPDSYLGPTSPDAPLTRDRFSKERHYSEDTIVLANETSFVLVFDRPPYPGMNFLLIVNGIQKDGKQLDLYPVRFHRQTAWRFDIVP
jgi:hypothetical protein